MSQQISKQTVLFDQHKQHGGKIVDFAGWLMPINYGSQIEEHHQVRTDAGMFDVSHMTVVDLNGEQVIAWVQIKEGETLNEEAVKSFCDGQIAHYKVPYKVEFVDEFPMTVTGKIQKFIMREKTIEEL